MFSKKFNIVDDLQDLTGKVVIVTGGNAGLGFATIKHLLRKNAKVYMASRSEEKATKAIETLKKDHGLGAGEGKGEVVWLLLDLSEASKTKDAAERFLKQEERLDILVNNAAAIWPAYEIGKDGVQESMMVNVVAQFLFTQTLLPLMIETTKKENADVRIINVSSGAVKLRRSRDANISFRTVDDLNKEYKSDSLAPFSRYAVSKLAFLLYTSELQIRLDAASIPIACISAHPGAVDTFTPEKAAAILPMRVLTLPLVRLLMQTPDVGAWNLCYAAAAKRDVIVGNQKDKEAAWGKFKGSFLGPVGKLEDPGKNGKRKELQKELWETVVKALEGAGINQVYVV